MRTGKLSMAFSLRLSTTFSCEAMFPALNAWLDDQALIARYLAARPHALKRAVRSYDTDCATVAWVDRPVPDNDRARNAHSHPIPPTVMRR